MDKTCINTKTYSGYLDQHDFIARYLFIRNRINNSFTRDELAFLLGKTPYFIIDYEELSGSTKLGLSELDILCRILKRGSYETLVLDRTFGKIDISYEKRMIRVIQKEYTQKLVYEFIHPWTSGGTSKSLKAEEPKYDFTDVERESKKLIKNEIARLIDAGFFTEKKTPLEIYERIWSTFRYCSDAWSAIFIKDIVYHFIREGKLTHKYLNGHLSYQNNSKIPPVKM
ncbi:hypothetical protein [Pedobacter hiemivivus]|uniref:Uncharacterized protein n=1 Tax=Pedobacter hiemivivus TaxID=2530454 RepID=A0A4R0N574_9SPHI|nr:hypothetical protein [Pedobacter hiemivivus]TCC95025.1 hypothetical protein EZ444_16085 [Pedobacter hiemivivus]